MKARKGRGLLESSSFRIELESVYSREREWRISKCYQEVIGCERLCKEMLKGGKEKKSGDKDEAVKISKKA